MGENIKLLPGDVLLISCFISYVGCFTRTYRLDLQNKFWIPYFKQLEVLNYFELIKIKFCVLSSHIILQPQIFVSEKSDPLQLICDDAQIAMWNNEGLPNDRMSAENATILTNTSRWPLIIDPQL